MSMTKCKILLIEDDKVDQITFKWLIKDKKLPKGFLFWLFVVMYSALRFIIEFFRQPDEQLGFIIGFLTMGQILSIIFLSVGLFFMYKIYKK